MKTADQWIARANIEHFRQRLAEETDESKRQMILRLLAEEEEKLRVAIANERDGKEQA